MTKPNSKAKPAAQEKAIPPISRAVRNPYREGSKKNRCFEIWRAGGARSAVIQKMVATGVGEGSAITWICRFKKHAATAQQRS